MGDLVPESRQGRVELLVEFFLPTVEVVKELLVSIGILLRLANHAFEIIELSSQLIPVVREFATYKRASSTAGSSGILASATIGFEFGISHVSSPSGCTQACRHRARW